MNAVFFDLDGTLTDSREGIVKCIQYALGELGAPVPPPSRLELCIGPPFQSALAELVGSAEGGLAAEALRLYRARYEVKGMFESRVYDGVPGLLEGVRTRRWRALVVTSKPTVYAKRIVGHFGLRDFFDEVYGSGLDGALTRKDDLIRYVLETESLAPYETVMVGDRRYDVEGARANGLRCIGVTYGFGSREELEQPAADQICTDPASVLTALVSLFDGPGC